MLRAAIVGSGSEIPGNLVTNAMLARVMDTSDGWIRERSGVETRYYVDPGVGTSDLGTAAARRALEAAEISPKDVDLVIFATMTPDHFFPGSGALLQAKLGMGTTPALDIRQQCVGFLYGLWLADAQIRAGLAQTVLLVGAEIHSGFMPWKAWDYLYGRSETPPPKEEYDWATRFRHLTVLFGDAGAAVVLRGTEDDRGVVDSILKTDGTEYEKLYVPGTGFKRRPYIDPDQLQRGDHIPSMDGRGVFKLATARMTEVAQDLLKKSGKRVEDLSLVLMHQANKRINEHVQKVLGIPEEKVLHNIHKYGNTTAATIPLLWDEAARSGRLKKGDLVLMVAFGAGMNWGATLLTA
jgi:3-oxoacyl-[acyl-carrier-protein] synthase-3